MATELPTNPFIEPGSPDITQHQIDTALALLEVYHWGIQEISSHSSLNDLSHHEGAVHIIRGIRTAVEYLAREACLADQGGNVSQLPGTD